MPVLAAAGGSASVDWQPLVERYLQPFAAGVTADDLDRAEQWAANATAFAATGSWRAKIVRGELWVKMLRVHSHWAERASVLRMLLLALRAGLPDVVRAVWRLSIPHRRPPRRATLRSCACR